MFSLKSRRSLPPRPPLEGNTEPSAAPPRAAPVVYSCDRASTERACASRPSARANVVIVSERFPSADLLAPEKKSISQNPRMRVRRAAEPLPGRKHMIWTGRIITGSFRAERAKKDAAGMVNLFEQRRVIDADVFGRKTIAQRNRLARWNRPPRSRCFHR